MIVDDARGKRGIIVVISAYKDYIIAYNLGREGSFSSSLPSCALPLLGCGSNDRGCSVLTLASKTRKTYASSVKLYSTPYALQGIQPSFPAPVASLSSWITKLSLGRVKAATIRSYLTAVRSTQLDMDLSDLSGLSRSVY